MPSKDDSRNHSHITYDDGASDQHRLGLLRSIALPTVIICNGWLHVAHILNQASKRLWRVAGGRSFCPASIPSAQSAFPKVIEVIFDRRVAVSRVLWSRLPASGPKQECCRDRGRACVESRSKTWPSPMLPRPSKCHSDLLCRTATTEMTLFVFENGGNQKT